MQIPLAKAWSGEKQGGTHVILSEAKDQRAAEPYCPSQELHVDKYSLI